MTPTVQSLDYQDGEALSNKLLQFDIDSNSLHHQYVSIEISKSVHSRLQEALSMDHNCGSLYNLDKFLHQILDKWQKDASAQSLQVSQEKPSDWRSQFRAK